MLLSTCAGVNFVSILSGVNFVWGIYDSSNEGIDAYHIGDILRALETNPTQATIEKMGGTKKKGKTIYILDRIASYEIISPAVFSRQIISKCIRK